TMVVSSSRDRRAATSTSEGICGGAPVRSSLWHDAQFCRYSALLLLPVVLSAIAPVQARSFAFTYNRPLSGSNADPPHSAPPSKPGNTTVSRPAASGTNKPSLLNVANLSSA